MTRLCNCHGFVRADYEPTIRTQAAQKGGARPKTGTVIKAVRQEKGVSPCAPGACNLVCVQRVDQLISEMFAGASTNSASDPAPAQRGYASDAKETAADILRGCALTL